MPYANNLPQPIACPILSAEGEVLGNFTFLGGAEPAVKDRLVVDDRRFVIDERVWMPSGYLTLVVHMIDRDGGATGETVYG